MERNESTPGSSSKYNFNSDSEDFGAEGYDIGKVSVGNCGDNIPDKERNSHNVSRRKSFVDRFGYDWRLKSNLASVRINKSNSGN